MCMSSIQFQQCYTVYLFIPQLTNTHLHQPLKGLSVVPPARRATRLLPHPFSLASRSNHPPRSSLSYILISDQNQITTFQVLVHYPFPLLLIMSENRAYMGPRWKTERLSLYTGRPFSWAPPLKNQFSSPPPFLQLTCTIHVLQNRPAQLKLYNYIISVCAAVTLSVFQEK